MTALSLYGLNAASGTLGTAATLASGTGGSSTTVNTAINSGSGYYELLGLGGTSSAVGSLPTPTANGWLWDVTTLVGNALSSGTYTLIGTVSIGSGTLGSCTLTLRVYKRSSGGVYTAICSGTSGTFTVTTTPTAQTITVNSVGSMSFATGDKLYVDAFLHGAPGSTRSIHVSVSSTSSGLANDIEIDTPGYSASASLKDVATRFRLMSANTFKDIATRFILGISQQNKKDIATRFRLTGNDDNWLISSSADLAGTLEGYVRHAFPGEPSDISNDSREVAMLSLIASIRANDNTSKPIIQGEMGFAAMGPGQSVALYAYGVEMTDYAVQLARAGMSALIAYDLDDDMHGTQWGMQQITTDPGTPRPWFFPWSLLCNFLVSGSTLYAPTQPATNDLRVLVAQSPQGAWTFVLVNRRATQQNVQVIVPFAPVVAITLNSYIYSSAAPLIVDGNGFPLPSGTVTAVLSRGFTVSIAPNSVLILTQQGATQTNVFDVKQPPLQRRR